MGCHYLKTCRGDLDELLIFIARIPIFQTGNFGQKDHIWTKARKNPPCHFGQVDFNMSNVTRKIFFTKPRLAFLTIQVCEGF
jgi:hypothetical protein